LIDGVLKPANKQVVDERQGYSGCHGIVCANVAEDGDFGSNLDIAEDEAHEETGEGALIWPLVEWIEHQFVAAICVFFPASELVVDGEGDAFFEAAIVVRGKADDEMVHLETQTDVKVFRDMTIRPEFGRTVFFPGDALDGFPADECVMPDERSAVAISNGKLN
jgi:hypothetical protein